MARMAMWMGWIESEVSGPTLSEFSAERMMEVY